MLMDIQRDILRDRHIPTDQSTLSQLKWHTQQAAGRQNDMHQGLVTDTKIQNSKNDRKITSGKAEVTENDQ